MLTFGNLFLGAFVLMVGLTFFFAAKGRARRLETTRPRDVSPEQKKENDAELRRLLAAGRKIEAIKSYRGFYGVGLKEAKDAVELFEKQNGMEPPGLNP